MFVYQQRSPSILQKQISSFGIAQNVRQVSHTPISCLLPYLYCKESGYLVTAIHNSIKESDWVTWLQPFITASGY